MKRLLSLFLLLTVVGQVAAQDNPRNRRQLARVIDRLVQDSSLAAASVGISVVNLESGAVLYQHKADRNLMPASNTKLYTTAVALDLLGPEFTWQTPLMALGEIRDSTLTGHLLVRGSGDPVIGGRYNEGDITAVFRSWADSLVEAGIRTVDGFLIGDDDLFDDLQLGYGWSWDDEPWWYSAEIGALSLNDNSVDFTVTPTLPGGPAQVTWEPINTDYVTVLNGTRTLPEDGRKDEEYARVRDGNLMTVGTLVPLGRVEEESIAVHNPTRYFLHVLREVLLQKGIAVTGGISDIDDLPVKPDPAGGLHIATHTSPPLKQVVHAINKVSHNLYAEQVLKTIGALLPDTTSDASPGSAAMGWARGRHALGAAGVDTLHIQLTDGSGLSRMNFIAPSMSTQLLSHMWNHPDDSTRAAFMRSLPIAGIDGTLENRLRDTPAEGNARAKTGTFTGASTLSGYVTSAAGTPLTFSIMVNGYRGSSAAARRLQDAVAETLARYRR
ncbi:MAG: D-alanyl-D-alanine carboxypeptidase/D-alanyl-D-alanine-endopeptidase [Rhodothermales bacterium]|nr:D-alanyl-D-alanine carboxypeptidase/D-alanyl-D-alanine-endopeptidase [Rhodothermales bacterium]